MAHSESARRPDQLTGGVNEYRYCRELGQLGLTSTSRWSFFVAVGGSLASLGLFNCLQDGKARVAAAGRCTPRPGTHRTPHVACLQVLCSCLAVFMGVFCLWDSLEDNQLALRGKPSKASRNSSVAWRLGKRTHQRVIMGKRLVLQLPHDTELHRLFLQLHRPSACFSANSNVSW